MTAHPSPATTPPASGPEPGEAAAGTVAPAVAAVGWLCAVTVPLWVAGGRFLTGTAGDLAVVYALTLAPVLLVLSVVALGIAWLCGVGLGLTLPDTGAGASSVLEACAGPEMSGVAAALSNPFAILMVLTAIIGCVLAVRDSRPGGPSRVTDEDDQQGTGFFPVLDV